MTRPAITIDPAAKPRRLRRAGARWRLLVHRVKPGRIALSEHAYTVTSDGTEKSGPYGSTQVLAGTEFDELVVGSWLHVEQMDTGVWWLDVGGITINVRADRDGRPTSVTVHGPLDYEGETRPGVTYECQWTDIPDPPRRTT